MTLLMLALMWISGAVAGLMFASQDEFKRQIHEHLGRNAPLN